MPEYFNELRAIADGLGRIAAAEEHRNELLEADLERREKAWQEEFELRRSFQLALLAEQADKLEEETDGS